MIGEGAGARTVRIDFPNFTFIGATTSAGQLAKPLLDRFGIPLRLIFYIPDELTKIVSKAAGLLGMNLTVAGAEEIAACSRGTPSRRRQGGSPGA